MPQKSYIFLLFCLAFASCGKRFEFEITDNHTEFKRSLTYDQIGDPSRMTITNVLFWNDTIIINGIKTSPLKDTIKNSNLVDYYGIDTMRIYNKYKATKWYIKEIYEFSPW